MKLPLRYYCKDGEVAAERMTQDLLANCIWDATQIRVRLLCAFFRIGLFHFKISGDWKAFKKAARNNFLKRVFPDMSIKICSSDVCVFEDDQPRRRYYAFYNFLWFRILPFLWVGSSRAFYAKVNRDSKGRIAVATEVIETFQHARRVGSDGKVLPY